jgi:hypothetical protein
MNLTSTEWIHIWNAAAKQWPGTELSRAEICRRYILIGIRKVNELVPADRDRMMHELQASMAAPDEKPEG